MNLSRILKIIPLFLLLLNIKNAIAQDNETDEDNPVSINEGLKGFHMGLFTGAYFANGTTAQIYDGYGLDINGKKNAFKTSFLYQKVVIENDPARNGGQPDRIAEELHIDHDGWHFDDPAYMPIDMKYNTTFLYGVDFLYGITKNDGIILNVNFAKLTATGTFTIFVPQPASNNTAEVYQYFPILGEEQRLMFQLGYSHIIGDNDIFNLLVEGGVCMNNAKFTRNTAQVNNYQMDLTSFIDQIGYIYYNPKNYVGWGFGGFAGVGINLSMNPKYTVQFLYSPSVEKINLGANPSPSLQNSAGLRFYYHL